MTTTHTMLEARQVVSRAQDLPFTALDGEFLGIDAQAGFCYSMNETAGKIWDLIATPTSVGDLCDCLRRQYTVDKTTCLREVTALIGQMADAGLIRVEEAPPT